MDGYQTIQISDTSLRVYSTGMGLPLLFVHGAAASLLHGEALAGQLKNRYRFITYSQRFHLPNDPSAPGPCHADQHAADLIELVEALGIQGCKVIGHSYGGAVILTAAAMQHTLFSEIYLAEPGLALLLNEREEYTSIREERALLFERIRNCFEKGRSEDAVATLMNYANGERGFNAFPPGIRADMVANASSLRRMAFETKTSLLHPGDLSNIKVPVTLFLGESCIPVYKAIAKELKKLIPQTEVKIIRGSAHDLIYTSPFEIASEMDGSFL